MSFLAELFGFEDKYAGGPRISGDPNDPEVRQAQRELDRLHRNYTDAVNRIKERFKAQPKKSAGWF